MSDAATTSAAALPERVWPREAGGVAVPDTRLHPIYLIIETAKTVRSAIPFLVVTILGGAPWWVNTILFALIMVVAVAQWHVKKYSVIGGVLRLRAGLVNRTVRVVPVTRITALGASRSLTQRLVGVWGLTVQSPGDRNGSAVNLGCLSGRRLDELRAALEAGHESSTPIPEPAPGPGSSTIQRYLAWRHSSTTIKAKHGPDVIAVLTTPEMLIAAVTNNTIPLIFAAALVVWFRFSQYVPDRAADFMNETVVPRGVIAVLIALVVVAIVGGVVLGALRLNRFTLIRDGDVLRNTRGLLGKQSATIPVQRIQAVRIVEGFWRMLIGYCSLQVEVAGIGRANTNQRMLFPLVRIERAEALIRRALPELPWPERPLAGPARAGVPPLLHLAAGVRRRIHRAAAVPAGLVAVAGDLAAAPRVRARRRPIAGGQVAGRRQRCSAPLAAGAHPQHGDRPSGRRATAPNGRVPRQPVKASTSEEFQRPERVKVRILTCAFIAEGVAAEIVSQTEVAKPLAKPLGHWLAPERTQGLVHQL